MTDIFDVPDLVDFEITNNHNHYFMLANRLIPPASSVANTTMAQPIRLSKLGVDFCTFKWDYRNNAELRDICEPGGLLELTPITLAGQGVVCPFDNKGIASGGSAPSTTQNGALWFKSPENIMFYMDTTVNKWLSIQHKEYSVGRGFALAQNIALFGIDGTPTSQTPILIPNDETIVGMLLESESNTAWSAEVRDFDTKIPIVGANLAMPVGQQTTHSTNFSIDLTAGTKVEIFLSSAGPISFPRVKIFTRLRG